MSFRSQLLLTVDSNDSCHLVIADYYSAYHVCFFKAIRVHFFGIDSNYKILSSNVHLRLIIYCVPPGFISRAFYSYQSAAVIHQRRYLIKVRGTG